MTERPKRKTIPRAIKRAVREKQEGFCNHCGKLLGADPVQFDHRPALWCRPVNGGDYIPPQLDPLFIDALHVHCHKARTFGAKHRRQGADMTEKARLARLEASAASHHQAMEAKRPSEPIRASRTAGSLWPMSGNGKRMNAVPGRSIPSRPFPKVHRPMRPQ